MASTVNTSIESLRATSRIHYAEQNLRRSLQRLTTGVRIARTAEDAAGLGVAENLSAENRSLGMAMRNSNDGISVVQTVEGATSEISDILKRIRELAVQSASDTLANQERSYVQDEYLGLVSEIDRIAEVTEFNGLALANSTQTIEVQVGTDGTADSRVGISLFDLRSTSASMLVDPLNVDLTSSANARSAIDDIDNAMDFINSVRSGFGAVSNTLAAALRQSDNYSVNLADAERQIRDTDFAVESAEATKLELMSQAAVAVLAQAKNIYDSAAQLISG